MARVLLQDVSFSYPVYEIGARSLKVTLASQFTGGAVGTNAGVVTVNALSRINLDLKDGDRIGLIGHNGSGKSTLLRVIAGLAHPRSGSIRVEGRVVPFITIGNGINPELSGMANIELPLRLLGASTREVKRAKEEIAEFTGLGNFINLPVRTYSDGMKARLSFAIATSIDADVLVLDEWLGAGDLNFQDKAEKRLRDLVDRTRIVVLATHNPSLVLRACNVATWLSSGSQVITGDPTAVVKAYTDHMSNPLQVVA